MVILYINKYRFVTQMIKELTPYQSGQTQLLDQIQATIDKVMRTFMVKQYQQSYSIKLTKEELEQVSPVLKRYMESSQGKDQKVYELNGDKNILNFLMHSPSADIRKKYFVAIAEANKDNIPLLLQILYHRLQKAKVLGYKNSIELLEGERAFKIPDPIKSIQNARKFVKTNSINSGNLTTALFKE
jgi:Zn-dependent oligopeptidase